MSINYSSVLRDVLNIAVRTRIAELTSYVSTETRRTVQAGPFAGMVLPEEVSWGNGDVLSKLLGTYEQELQPAIEKAISRNPEVVFNVGCAEGYYAVGLARRLPVAQIVAFDISYNAFEVCANTIQQNSVANALIYCDEFTSRLLSEWKCHNRQALIVMDIEGDEVSTLMPASEFTSCDLIVECHDFSHPYTTDELVLRFKDTHDIEVIPQGPRDPHSLPLLAPFGDLDKWLCMTEGRPLKMNWLVAWSKKRP